MFSNCFGNIFLFAGLDEDEEDNNVVPQKTVESSLPMSTNVESNNMEVTTSDGQDDSKKIKSMDENTNVGTNNSNKSATLPGQTTLNLPIPNSKGQAAIVKIYGADDGTFKLNQMVEFIGIVSLDPQLASAGDDMDTDDVSVQFNMTEIRTK